MFYYSSVPSADWERYNEAQEKELEKLPICDSCGKRITDDYLYEVCDCIFCEECINDSKKDVENYVY